MAGVAAAVRLVLTPGRKGGTWFVLPSIRNAAALVADCFPVLSDDGPQPVSVKTSKVAPTSASPARRAVREWWTNELVEW